MLQPPPFMPCEERGAEEKRQEVIREAVEEERAEDRRTGSVRGEEVKHGCFEDAEARGRLAQLSEELA